MGWAARSGRWSGWRAGRRAWATRRASRARCAAAPRPRAAPITLHRASYPSRALSCAEQAAPSTTLRRDATVVRCAEQAAPSRQRRAGCVDQAAPRPRAAPSTLRCA
ncbi:hypothetical protein T492DRAFT_898733 [Pavlovales sp. CCMP2436]|nr:hypothetical protein T492DRAFT_898733 [Pavlovales sp. CCMP2436]